MPDIPDFTKQSWQRQRNEAQITVSILDGKGKDMPAFRGKIKEDQARDLAAHVRTFAPSKGKPGVENSQESTSPTDFEKELRRLQKEMDELKRQFRQVPKSPPEDKSSKSSNYPPDAQSSERSDSPHPAARQPPAPARAATPADRELFRQHCVKCHGADGTGKLVRAEQSEIPDFTDASWQARRTDAQLLASILDGKGKQMPSWRGKINEEQARGLVDHVRTFDPPKESQGQEQQEETSPGEVTEQAEPRRSVFESLIGWFGKFHPAIVHFPIALLTAAALAELLRMVTGKPSFEPVSRYCVWLGFVTAVLAGGLGWFAGSSRLSDDPWILTTHRWLGTSTVACAALVLVLCEVSRRPDPGRTGIWFRVTLLGVAVLGLVTGFFGGALVFGLDHYAWPQ
jgi:mono/diheme cytochrome c family protein/uncharacterized membrane protein